MEYFRKKPNQNQGVPFSLFRGASVAERNLSGGCFGKEGHGRRAGEVPKSQAACLRRGRGDLDLRRKGTHAGAFWWWEGYILPKPLRGPFGKAARHERSRAGLSKISFLCRLPELPNVGRPQLPLPTTKRRCPDGYRLLVVGRVHIAETPEGSPRQSGAAREEQGRVEQNFFPVPLARTAERRQTSITSSRNTKGDAPMGIAFWWWEEVDSNYRSRRRQIYSLIHLAALESSRMQYKTGEWLRVGVGAGDWNRTHNLLITNQLLCQLSYTSMGWCLGAESNHRHRDFQSLALPTELPRHFKACLAAHICYQTGFLIRVATRNGLEPSTSSVTGWRSNQLNYRAVI